MNMMSNFQLYVCIWTLQVIFSYKCVCENYHNYSAISVYVTIISNFQLTADTDGGRPPPQDCFASIFPENAFLFWECQNSVKKCKHASKSDKQVSNTCQTVPTSVKPCQKSDKSVNKWHNCWLLIGDCWLLIVDYCLLIVDYRWFIIDCS